MWHSGELTIEVVRTDILKVLKTLRDDGRCQFEVLIDVCGVDWPEREDRFDVVYHLLAPRLNQRIRVKLATNDTDTVPSAVAVFPAADWFEREAYDMYGILFARPSRSAPPADGLRLSGLSAAQGLSSYRSC